MDMESQDKHGDAVEKRSLDAEGNPVGDSLVVRYTTEGKVGERPRSESGESVSSRQEITTMDLTAPGNSLAEAVGRLLPLFEEWLKKQVGQVEEVPSVSADATAPPVKEWYSPEEASVVINRTPNHVRELCRGKVFGKHDSGGRWVIHRKELEAFRLGRLKVHGEKFE